MEMVLGLIPEKYRATAMVRLFGLFKIPLLFFIRPKVLHMDDERVEVLIPFNRRTKNHLNSMYFGVLCAGADLAGGLLAMHHCQKKGGKISLSFKDFHADFLKRAHGDVIFRNEDGAEIKKFVEEVLVSGERGNREVNVVATCPEELGDTPVATFTLTLSLKVKA